MGGFTKDGEVSKEKAIVAFPEKVIGRANCSHFGSPTKPDVSMKAAEGVVPMNTKRTTDWAVRVFASWIEECNQCVEEQIEADILTSNDPERVSYVLQLFVLEARKADSEKYPLATIRSLLSDLSRELLKNKPRFAVLEVVFNFVCYI